MNLPETEAFLIWLNQIDPRVEPNDASAEAWQRALAKYPAALCREVALDWTAKNSGAPRPAPIRDLVKSQWEHHLRLESRKLLTNDPTKISFVEFKKRNPGRALAAYQEGYRQTHGCDDPSPPEWTRDDSSASILKSMKF